MSQLKTVLHLMDQVCAARRGMVCELGHFHPTVTPVEALLVVAMLVHNLRKHNDLDTASTAVAIDMMGVLAQAVHDDLDLDPDHTYRADELIEMLGLRTETELLLAARAIGLEVASEGRRVH